MAMSGNTYISSVKHNLLSLGLLWLIFSCSSPQKLARTTASNIPVKGDSLQLFDSAVWSMILPYKLKLDSQMNEVIVQNKYEMKKEQPEAVLGNLITDAMLWYARKNTALNPHCAAMNYGGIRIPSIPPGSIVVRQVYELMPFDNMIDILEVKGETLIRLCEHMALNGGWPVSRLRYVIKDRHATDISIDGLPVSPDATYLLVTSDYLSGGGDKTDMLKEALKRIPLNYKLRDAIIDYLRELSRSNTSLSMQPEGRVIKAIENK